MIRKGVGLVLFTWFSPGVSDLIARGGWWLYLFARIQIASEKDGPLRMVS